MRVDRLCRKWIHDSVKAGIGISEVLEAANGYSVQLVDGIYNIYDEYGLVEESKRWSRVCHYLKF